MATLTLKLENSFETLEIAVTNVSVSVDVSDWAGTYDNPNRSARFHVEPERSTYGKRQESENVDAFVRFCHQVAQEIPLPTEET